MPGILTNVLGMEQRRAFALMALNYGALMVVLYWLLVLRVRERPDFAERKTNPLVPGVRRSLRNRPFAVLFTCYASRAFPARFPGCSMPYFSRYVLNPPPIELKVADGWLSVFLVRLFPVGSLVSAALACARQARGEAERLAHELRHGRDRRARAVPARARQQPRRASS